MVLPCPYCHGSGKFRHQRPPNVSDKWWFNMVGQQIKCPLCKGLGKIERPVDALIVDTGLIFIKDLERKILVGCPDPNCTLWVDATEAFSHREMDVKPGGSKVTHAQTPQKDFAAKCPNGHDVVLLITPSTNRWNPK